MTQCKQLDFWMERRAGIPLFYFEKTTSPSRGGGRYVTLTFGVPWYHIEISIHRR